MIKKFTLVIVLLIASLSAVTLYAQNDSIQKGPVYKVGIFAPLYLDSVFNKNTFKYKQAVPRFIMPAVDFVQGALIALDSLQAGEDYIDASVYDTRSYTENISGYSGCRKDADQSYLAGSTTGDYEFYIEVALRCHLQLHSSKPWYR